jgi:hypothetical protein
MVKRMEDKRYAFYMVLVSFSLYTNTNGHGSHDINHVLQLLFGI